MDVLAKIEGIKYSPNLCRELSEYQVSELDKAMSKDGTFILSISRNTKIVLSWWVSAKRTRSYPYARVYDCLGFQGKKVTVIPIVKDEGKEGDRDFLQWDTISLMSLLGVYTIISFYSSAERSSRYRHKITNQRFDISHLKKEINNLLAYQSDALHWNLAQVENVGEIGKKAIDSYKRISKELEIEMHSEKSARKRVEELLTRKRVFYDTFKGLSQESTK